MIHPTPEQLKEALEMAKMMKKAQNDTRRTD